MADQREPHRSATERVLIREVRPRDLKEVYRLAGHLDSVNIPHDEGILRRLIRHAAHSFSGRVDLFRRHYLFVLEGADSGRLYGTSMIYAQHGHPEAPHVFFDVIDDERYSSTLDSHFSHQTLRLGFSYRGPTEIGALVLDPVLRGAGLGKPLSFVRFLFVAMYRERFHSRIIAELMPPLEPDGRSLLWEYLGRHFTGLTYQEADRLSHHNKEFIYALFPQSPLYASLLPPEVRQLIGQVGPETQGVQRMLESIGFRYSQRIDPFDGGPHFRAQAEDIVPIRDAHRVPLSPESLPEPTETAILSRDEGAPLRRLIGVGRLQGPTRFRATVAGGRLRDGALVTSEATRRLLRVKPGQEVWTVEI
jgi:arginine N-succinyltransferase